jgi:hypothetical protein
MEEASLQLEHKFSVFTAFYSHQPMQAALEEAQKNNCKLQKMVGQHGKLFERINESNTDQKTKEAYEHIYTSVSEKYLRHIQQVRRLHVTESSPPTGPESSPPTSSAYLPETGLMASPPGPSTPAALPIDEDTEHDKQSFTAYFDDYCLIHKGAKDFAWYLQRSSYATHFGGPFSHYLCYLELSLLCHANHHRWMRLQEHILGESGHPIYHLVTRPTQELSFANGNDTTTHG